MWDLKILQKYDFRENTNFVRFYFTVWDKDMYISCGKYLCWDFEDKYKTFEKFASEKNI